MNNKKNYISALVLQSASILQGLILPRLILLNFGSEVNGLVSSITQFLSFISLFEGGLGAVALAELYKPIEDNDTERVKTILYACQRFFRMLAGVFVIYTLGLAIAFSKYIAIDFQFTYVFVLVVVLSVSTLAQYLFSITNKLLLQADQKVYIVNTIMAITLGLNLLLAVIVIKIYPNIHIVKLISAIVFLIQPLLYSRFVQKKYSIHNWRPLSQDKNVLKNKWSGFAQNLAYFINMNTDIAVITIFACLTEVSVYSIYMLAIVALRSIIISSTNSYQSALGKYYAEGDMENLREKFGKFETSFWIAGIILFSTCLLLINPFVSIYTKGLEDINYYRPIFAMLITLANMLYCVREPYRVLILAAGKFRETNFGSIAEAVINLVISLLLVSNLGITGAAIGTLVAVIYRLVYFVPK